MSRIVKIEVCRGKDEKDSLPDSQIFVIGSKVYDISQEFEQPYKWYFITGNKHQIFTEIL